MVAFLCQRPDETTVATLIWRESVADNVSSKDDSSVSIGEVTAAEQQLILEMEEAKRKQDEENNKLDPIDTDPERDDKPEVDAELETDTDPEEDTVLETTVEFSGNDAVVVQVLNEETGEWETIASKEEGASEPLVVELSNDLASPDGSPPQFRILNRTTEEVITMDQASTNTSAEGSSVVSFGNPPIFNGVQP
ncbi:MAG: hypothetical protein ACI84R_001224 [Candidatus Azotimanducaceae bacterium]|jgi:hypothetical protein